MYLYMWPILYNIYIIIYIHTHYIFEYNLIYQHPRSTSRSGSSDPKYPTLQHISWQSLQGFQSTSTRAGLATGLSTCWGPLKRRIPKWPLGFKWFQDSNGLYIYIWTSIALELRITHTQMMFMRSSTQNSFFLLVAAKGDGTWLDEHSCAQQDISYHPYFLGGIGPGRPRASYQHSRKLQQEKRCPPLQHNWQELRGEVEQAGAPVTSVQAPTCQKYLQPLTLGCNEAWFSYVTNAPSIGVFGYLLSTIGKEKLPLLVEVMKGILIWKFRRLWWALGQILF